MSLHTVLAPWQARWNTLDQRGQTLLRGAALVIGAVFFVARSVARVEQLAVVSRKLHNPSVILQIASATVKRRVNHDFVDFFHHWCPLIVVECPRFCRFGFDVG